MFQQASESSGRALREERSSRTSCSSSRTRQPEDPMLNAVDRAVAPAELFLPREVWHNDAFDRLLAAGLEAAA